MPTYTTLRRAPKQFGDSHSGKRRLLQAAPGGPSRAQSSRVSGILHALPTRTDEIKADLLPEEGFEPHFGGVTDSSPGQRKRADGVIGDFDEAAQQREILAGVLRQGRGGKKLPHDFRQQAESAFHADLAPVRYHENPELLSIGVEAIAHGAHVTVASGRLDFSSYAGRQLLGHEIAHVLQQRAGRVVAPHGEGSRINADPHLEEEAEEQGRQFAQGGFVTRRISQNTPIGSPPHTSIDSPVQMKAMVGWTPLSLQTLAGGRRGRSAQYRGILEALEAYEQLQDPIDPLKELAALERIVGAAEKWKQRQTARFRIGWSSRTATRWRHITNLEERAKKAIKELIATHVIAQQSSADFKPFEDKNVTSYTKSAASGQVNTLDYVEYNFSAGRYKTNDLKLPGIFKGYFKEHLAEDRSKEHRGDYTGIPRKNPRYGERSVAMYKLDKLLDANVIAPTFFAKHHQRTGYVQEKIEGAEGHRRGEYKTDDPRVKRGLSKLYLLDYIAGQVDRTLKNFIVEKDQDGNIVGIKGIDNDLAFGEDYLTALESARQNPALNNRGYIHGYITAGKLPEELKMIDLALAERIIAINEKPDDVEQTLNGLLTKAEIDATLKRLSTLATFLQTSDAIRKMT